MTLILAMLSFQAVHGDDAEEPPSEFSRLWIDKFQREYPAAASALATAASDVCCRGTYSAPHLISSRSTPDDVVRMDFELCEKGAYLRWRQGAPPHFPFVIKVRNGTDNFEITESGTEPDRKYHLRALAYASESGNDIFDDVLGRRFVHSTTWLWDFRDLIESYRSGDLSLESAQSHPDNVGWITYTVRQSHRRGDQQNVGYGTITLDPIHSWAIREWKYSLPYKVPVNVQMNVDVLEVPEIGVVPRACSFRSDIKRNNSDWQEMELYTWEMSRIEKCKLSYRDFQLSAFGIADPREKTSYFVKINIGVIVFLMIAVFLRRYYAKR